MSRRSAGTLGLYRPGDSPLHRLPAGAKLLGLLALGIISVFLTREWWIGLIGIAVMVIFYWVGARFSLLVAFEQIRPMLMVLAFMWALNTWGLGWERSTAIVAVVVILALAAALVTLTTRATEMIDALVRAAGGLRRFGVDPDRVGLALALGIRCVPLVTGLATQVLDAQRARGNDRSIRAFAVPLLVSALRDADAMGEALIARGVDDD